MTTCAKGRWHPGSGRVPGPYQDALVTRVAVAGACWLAIYAVVNHLSPRFPAGGAALFHLVSALPVVVSALVVVRTAWFRGRRGGGDIAWVFFAAASALLMAGAVIWSLQDPAASSSGAAGRVGEIVSGIACLTSIPGFVLAFRWVRRLDLSRSFLDVGLVAVGLGALAWYGLLAPAIGGSGAAIRLLDVAYPIGGIVVLVVLLALGLGRFRQLPLAVRVVACAYLVTGVTSCVEVTRGVGSSSHLDGSWVHLGYQLSALLFLLGGLRAARLRDLPWPPPTAAPVATDVPLLVSGTAAGLVAARAYLHDGGSWIPLLLVTIAVTGLVARQQRTIRDRDRLTRRLAESLAEQQELAVTGGLTDLRNRRYFGEALTTEVVRARRHGRPLSLVLLDIDHFKKINDTHGHIGGDQALVALADLLRSLTRAGDVVARYGGEEFAWLLPDTDEAGAAVMAERMRAALQSCPVDLPGGVLCMTASLGVACGTGQIDALELVRRADEALYRAKAAGRNQVRRAAETELALAY